MTSFRLGQQALDVCQCIIDHHPAAERVGLIAHVVHTNWRQIYDTPEKQAQRVLDGLKHETPLEHRSYSRREFLDLTMDALDCLPEEQVWSMTSKVISKDGEIMHLPMMNFHPQGVQLDDIIAATRQIVGARPGALLDSGRFSHYYGDFFLTEREWPRFMGEFLGPCVLVSPRYIGHRLHHGYSTLRLTANKVYKPKVPEVIEVL